ncbi:MAG: hypothetical protein N3B13_05900 [Deltaproteobacteria bacterium]|nr:hypothetical protein [Deltaproteobacteria bacterium]
MKNGELSIEEFLSYRDEILKSLGSEDAYEVKQKVVSYFDAISSEKITEKDVFRMEAEIVSGLLDGSFVNINRYHNEKRSLEILAFSGLSSLVETMIKFGSVKIVGKELLLEDKFAELMLMRGILHRIPGGLKDAVLKGYPDALVTLLDEMFGPFLCYAGGFLYRGQLVGNLAIVTKNIMIDSGHERIINLFLPVFGVAEMIYRKSS